MNFYGIANDGNSCFRNVVLQALACCDDFLEFLGKQQSGNESFSRHLHSFLMAISTRSTSSATHHLKVPSELHLLHSTAASSFRIESSWRLFGEQQQDAHEYFQKIMDTLDMPATSNKRNGIGDILTLPLSKSPSGKIIMSDMATSNIRNPFVGMTTTLVECLICGYCSSLVVDTFTSLSVPVGSFPSSTTTSISVDSLLDSIVRSEKLDEYKCLKCGIKHTLQHSTNHHLKQQLLKFNLANLKDVDLEKMGIQDSQLLYPQTKLAQKRTFITKYPKILCLHAERTIVNANGHVVKSNIPISMSGFQHLDLKLCEFQILNRKSKSLNELIVADLLDSIRHYDNSHHHHQQQSQKFNLKCIISHLGTSHSSGHFISYRQSVQSNESTWYRVSDDSISSIGSFEDVCNVCSPNVYMLFYQQKQK